MGGKSEVIKELGVFEVGGQGALVAPQREVMVVFMDEAKLNFLTPRDITEQCDNAIKMFKDIKTQVGLWDRETPYRRVLNLIQSLITDNNWDARRIRRRAGQAAVDAKVKAVPKFGQERMPPVDSASGSK